MQLFGGFSELLSLDEIDPNKLVAVEGLAGLAVGVYFEGYFLVSYWVDEEDLALSKQERAEKAKALTRAQIVLAKGN